MTCTIMGRCRKTGRVDYAIATVSLYVGSVCLTAARSGGLVVSQAFTNRILKAEGVRRLDEGMEPSALMAHFAAVDLHFILPAGRYHGPQRAAMRAVRPMPMAATTPSVRAASWSTDGMRKAINLSFQKSMSGSACTKPPSSSHAVVAEPRRQLSIVAPLSPYQHMKARDLSDLMSSAEWEEHHLSAAPPPCYD